MNLILTVILGAIASVIIGLIYDRVAKALSASALKSPKILTPIEYAFNAAKNGNNRDAVIIATATLKAKLRLKNMLKNGEPVSMTELLESLSSQGYISHVDSEKIIQVLKEKNKFAHSSKELSLSRADTLHFLEESDALLKKLDLETV
jgi:hypothetical protein